MRKGSLRIEKKIKQIWSPVEFERGDRKRRIKGEVGALRQ
jgi:hypothetical protein